MDSSSSLRSRPGGLSPRAAGRWIALGGILALAACGTTVPQTTTISGRAAGSLGRAAGGAAGATDPGSGSAPDSALATVSGPTTAVDRTETTGLPAGQVADGTTISTASPTGGPRAQSSTGRSTTTGRSAAGAKTGAGTASKPGAKASPGPGVTTKGGAAGQSGVTLANGPGITPTTIALGVLNVQNAQAYEQALGDNAQTGSPYQDAVAVANYINKNGGINGRMLTIKPYNVDAESTATTDQQDQAICANYTEDNPVFGYLYPADAELRTCLAASHLSMVGSGVDDTGSQELAKSPTYVDVSENSPEDEMTNLVNTLAGDGYYTTKWNTATGSLGGALPVKLGILTPDTARWQDAVDNVLLPALKAHGITVDPADVVTYPFPKSTTDDATTITDIGASVLKFSSDNVTNLLPVEVNALAFFSSAAQTQKYFPRYGLTTSTQAQSLVTGGLVPASELAGSVGFGNLPTLDLTDASAFGTPGLKRCLDIMTGAQISTSGQLVQQAQAFICDEFFLFAQAAAAIPASQALTDTAVVASIERIGTTFESATLPSTDFGPMKHYPSIEGYPMGWDAGCSCMKYTGPGFTLK